MFLFIFILFFSFIFHFDRKIFVFVKYVYVEEKAKDLSNILLDKHNVLARLAWFRLFISVSHGIISLLLLYFYLFITG